MHKEEPERLEIDVSRLAVEGETLEGEIDIVDVDEEFVKPFGGVRYKLDAQAFGNELLVRGSLEQDFDLVCSKCGRDFDTTVKVPDFTASFEVGEKQSVVDITDEVREAVLLELPAYPECGEDCPGFQQKESDFSSFRFFDSSNELEKLKFGNN
ncbi:MAG: hypothetical protein J6W80_04110 [Kiritimatiellae bacterium]|nr:hypothetical protein [Kiritimatiellia bacterium]